MALRLTRRLGFAVSAATERHRNRLLLSLSSPSESLFLRDPVDSVSLPGVEGAFTITNNHSQTVTQLRNGVITVKTDAMDTKSFFLSDGFLVYKAPSDDSGCCTAEVVGVEVVPVEALDKENAAQVLQELLHKAASSTNDWDKTKAILGQELCSAIMRHA